MEGFPKVICRIRARPEGWLINGARKLAMRNSPLEEESKLFGLEMVVKINCARDQWNRRNRTNSKSRTPGDTQNYVKGSSRQNSIMFRIYHKFWSISIRMSY